MFDHPLLTLTTAILATAIVILALPEMDDRLAAASAIMGVLTLLALMVGTLMA